MPRVGVGMWECGCGRHWRRKKQCLHCIKLPVIPDDPRTVYNAWNYYRHALRDRRMYREEAEKAMGHHLAWTADEDSIIKAREHWNDDAFVDACINLAQRFGMVLRDPRGVDDVFITVLHKVELPLPRCMVRSSGHCAKCRQPFEKLKTCGRCLETKYCSARCQREHWPEHKRTCAVVT